MLCIVARFLVCPLPNKSFFQTRRNNISSFYFSISRNDTISYRISFVPKENSATLQSQKRYLRPVIPVSPVTSPHIKQLPGSPSSLQTSNLKTAELDQKTAEDSLLEELHEVMDGIDGTTSSGSEDEEFSLSLTSNTNHHQQQQQQQQQQRNNYENMKNENDEDVFTPNFISTPFRQQQQQKQSRFIFPFFFFGKNL